MMKKRLRGIERTDALCSTSEAEDAESADKADSLDDG